MPKKEPKEWTIIVYLSGDNNLAEETVFALKEMYRIGTTRDFNVVVLHDVGGNHYTFDVPEAKMRPVEVAKVEGSAGARRFCLPRRCRPDRTDRPLPARRARRTADRKSRASMRPLPAW